LALLGVEPRPLTNRVSVLPLHYRRSSKKVFINKLKTLPIDLAKPDLMWMVELPWYRGLKSG
jgi:hypothetical protein